MENLKLFEHYTALKFLLQQGVITERLYSSGTQTAREIYTNASELYKALTSSNLNICPPDVTGMAPAKEEVVCSNFAIHTMTACIGKGLLTSEINEVSKEIDRAFCSVWKAFVSGSLSSREAEALQVALKHAFFLSPNSLTVVFDNCNALGGPNTATNILTIADEVYSTITAVEGRDSDCTRYFNSEALKLFNDSTEDPTRFGRLCVSMIPSTYMTNLHNPGAVVMSAFAFLRRANISDGVVTQVNSDIARSLEGVRV